MSTTKAKQPTTPFQPLTDIGARSLEAVSAVSEAAQRVGGQMIELWATTAADRLRALGEMQSATMEVARGALAPIDPREAFEELGKDPVLWYHRGMLSMLYGTHRVLTLMQANARIVSRSAEQVQGAAERTGKEIDSAVSACASRLRELYATRA